MRARLQLGDPGVGSVFGAKLSRARAWSAGALFLSMVAIGLSGRVVNVWWVLDVVIPGILGVGLIARLPWARAAVAGYVFFSLLHLGLSTIAIGGLWWDPVIVLIYGLQAAVLALVMPWRRGEVGSAGSAVAPV